MRITAEKKEETRRNIVQAASDLFLSKGFKNTTTRDIANLAKIATGTLFNYYPTKESIVLEMALFAQERAAQSFPQRLRGGEALDEQLFAHIASGIRELAPIRSYLSEVFDTAMSPFVSGQTLPQAEELRNSHLAIVDRLIDESRPSLTPQRRNLLLHLYWTLYLGVIAFWTRDESYHQEQTLALLDQSMKLFANAVISEILPTSSLSQPLDHDGIPSNESATKSNFRE